MGWAYTHARTAAAAVIPYKRTVLFQLQGSERTSRVVIDGNPIINRDFIFCFVRLTPSRRLDLNHLLHVLHTPSGTAIGVIYFASNGVIHCTVRKIRRIQI